ncbi:hypothetical protein [Kyrpidia sp.]|uniref:hypothetical protein n=1 Tax=Kyrpidia sp. TaxID=2073077 RepID=UPI00258F1606|nr:hypothetical protein [Kyrpidia sp.]MCL6575010.1 isopentenyl transferase family protein [Kyrpidia sp.]
MKVYGLVGPSGSGKSHHAARIAAEVGADCIIDDGLLIRRGRPLAGASAKFEFTKLGAARRAIFADDLHRKEVAEALKQLQPSTCLVLGTSEKMIRLICSRLGIRGEIEWIPIESVVSVQHLTEASDRRKRGMHAIPAVGARLSRGAGRRLIQELGERVLGTGIADLGRAKVRISRSPDSDPDLTVVFPLFHNGGVFIHPRAVEQGIRAVVQEGHPSFRVRGVVYVNREPLHLALHVVYRIGPDLPAKATRLLRALKTYLQEHLGFPYVRLDLVVEAVDLHPTEGLVPSLKGQTKKVK